MRLNVCAGACLHVMGERHQAAKHSRFCLQLRVLHRRTVQNSPMARILAIDVEALLLASTSAGTVEGVHRLQWLIEALRPYHDIRVVLLALRNRTGVELEQLALGELRERVIGTTFNLPQHDALIAALRIYQSRVDHLVVVTDAGLVPASGFEVLVCESGLGGASAAARKTLERWLSRTRPVITSSSLPRRLRGYGERVLYLDYDGVLHHENVLRHPRRGIYAGPPGFVLFEHAPLLETLLERFPEVRIVLSTSWVRVLSYSRALERLPRGLQMRVIGATFHSEMDAEIFASKTRGRQVLEDVARRQPKSWIALDDTNEGWPTEIQNQVVITDERLGISAPGMLDRITSALGRMV